MNFILDLFVLTALLAFVITSWRSAWSAFGIAAIVVYCVRVGLIYWK